MKEWLTISEAAVIVGRHVSRIYRWVDQGVVQARENEMGVLVVRSAAVREAEGRVKRGRPRGTASHNRRRDTPK